MSMCLLFSLLLKSGPQRTDRDRSACVVSLRHLSFEAEFLSETDWLWLLSTLQSDPMLVEE